MSMFHIESKFMNSLEPSGFLLYDGLAFTHEQLITFLN
jgi:hypothetical protein